MNWLMEFILECLCSHEYGPILEYHDKGRGVCFLACKKCTKVDTYDFTYEEEPYA